MTDKIHPYAFVIFGSVVALIFCTMGYRVGGSSTLFVADFALMLIVGVITGLNWRVYPWQIGAVGFIPSFLFLLWRMITSKAPIDNAINYSLFVFLPVISLVGVYFGAYVGRFISHHRKRKASPAVGQPPEENNRS